MVDDIEVSREKNRCHPQLTGRHLTMGSQVQLNLETQLPPLLFGADLFPVVWQGILCKYSQRKLLKERLCRQLLGYDLGPKPDTCLMESGPDIR